MKIITYLVTRSSDSLPPDSKAIGFIEFELSKFPIKMYIPAGVPLVLSASGYGTTSTPSSLRPQNAVASWIMSTTEFAANARYVTYTMLMVG